MSDKKQGGASNTPPKTSQRLDFLELTFPTFGTKPSVAYPEHWAAKRVETKPFNGYSVAARYADGRVELTHPDHPGMGTHVVMSGQVLTALQEDDLWLLEYFITHGAKITRLDCALDVFDTPLDFNELWELANSGEYDCRLRKPPLRTTDTKLGDTIYFGRMKSSVFTRIYNKAAEQGHDGAWVRVETVFRHSRANNAAKLMVKRKLEPAALIRGHINIPRLQWWTDVMTTKAEKTKLDTVEADKRLEWLMNTVPGALAKEMHLHGDIVWEQFKARVFEKLSQL